MRIDPKFLQKRFTVYRMRDRPSALEIVWSPSSFPHTGIDPQKELRCSSWSVTACADRPPDANEMPELAGLPRMPDRP